ncbi:hypothetical protein [Alteromonas aestuariivivens]|uniref:hypothetical protein n=1 Tax=Alteromonas aestuariivivens TaxID=1938339 RepID=UPI0024821894|nr:hypothetical protein [Alteromonas aestuariivivens]
MYLSGSTKVFTKIWYGELSLTKAIADDKLKVVGEATYRQTLQEWFGISSFTTEAPRFVAPDYRHP